MPTCIPASGSAARLRGRVLLLLSLWLLTLGAARAQVDSLGGLTRKFLRYQAAALPEKLFLHLDRPLYSSGETMWFKIYAVDGTYHKPLALSTVAYVEVLNQEHQPVMQGKIRLEHATGQGSLVIPAALASGVYTVRAYTRWMQNVGPEFYFQTPVTVVNTTLPSGTALSNDSATVDVQFFPEGGNLVQGLSSKVGFKVTDRTGHGLAATGQVLNQDQQVVATFGTLRLGMGSFLLTPEAGTTYSALITVPGHPAVRRRLPRVYEQGYVMRLENNQNKLLTLAVSSTQMQPTTVYLLVHSRQKVAAATQAPMVNGRAVFILDRGQLLDGISHLTVFSAGQKPVCERLYFKQPTQRLGLSAHPDKSQYSLRDAVTIQVAAAGENAQPVGANMSLAVYRLDSLNTAPAPDINSYVWLTSDLAGTIEKPDDYFTDTTRAGATAADNLMLTQGWSRFRWEQVLTTPLPAFEHLPERNGPVVQGRLTQAGTHKPREGITTYLTVPSRIIRLNNAVSNADGLVQFEMNNFYGSHDILVQTDPQQDSTCQITIAPAFSPLYAPTPPLAFTVVPRLRADYARRHLQTQVQHLYADRYQRRPTIPSVDSLAFYGQPDETYLLDTYTRFKVVEEVMREYVPGVEVRIRKDGFHFIVVDKVNKKLLRENPMVLLDGLPVFNVNKIMAMNPLKIRKLEVIDSRYFHGRALYNGIVSYTTYKGDLEGFPLDPRVLVQQYEGLQGQREFYAPRYDTPQQKQSRLPDLRNLLYWNPELVSTGTEAARAAFFTGDQAGRYRVVVQGLSATGLAGSTSFTFEVKPSL